MSVRDPHTCTDLTTARIKHIRLDLTVDFEQHRLRGFADYHFDSPLPEELRLDTKELEIEQVASQNGALRDLKWHLGEESFLGKPLVVQGVKGKQILRIHFQTSPESPALQWLEPAQTAGGKHPYLFSQCQAILARSVFPCQDSPSVRFTYEAQLRVPRGLTALLAALPVGRSREGDSEVFSFRMPHPIPSYLFAIAVGHIAGESIGARSHVFAEPEMLKEASWEFGEVDAMINGAQDLFGRYVWDKFDLLVMPPSFPYGGMENPTLTFITPTLIAGDRSLVGVVAHELAHSWTGNLVTNATWEDFWLNEGWTVYAERRILERMYGADHANLQAAHGRLDLLDAFKNHGGADSPYTKLKTDLKSIDPDEVFSSVPYEKGFLLLVALEQEVGRARFDPFVRDYIKDFAFTSITTETFVEYVERKFPGVPAKIGMDRWLHEPGLPDSAAVFHSPLIDEVHEVEARWKAGDRSIGDRIAKWEVHQKILFLGALEKRQTPEDCSFLDRTFDVAQTRNSEIILPFLCIAAASSYTPALERIRTFLASVGRGKYLRPLYRALHNNPDTIALARELFDLNQARYHSVARSAVARILNT